MRAAPIPENEAARLETLRQYQVLDTEPEGTFDDLTRLAAYVCQTPTALISLVDANRQWFKARVGVQARETPRNVSFCGHAILRCNGIPLKSFKAALRTRAFPRALSISGTFRHAEPN